MLLLVLFGGGSYGQTWQKVELKDLTSGDVFVIAEIQKSSYAMSNDNGASKAPSAVRITLSEDGTTIKSSVTENLMWNVGKGKVENSYIFYPNGDNKKWLYCINDNDGVRVGGTNDNKTFVLKTDNSNNYLGLFNTTQKRYVGVYSSSTKQDWRCYKTVNNNIKGQQIAFYKYVDDTRTATNVTFGENEDGKTSYVTEGEESSFSGKIATEKDGVAGTINYSSNNTAVVSVDETTGAVTFVKAPGTATITALFTPADEATYKGSSASYTINYKEKVRIATTLKFATPSGSVNIGETFTLPELTLKAGEETLTGRTFTYSSSVPKVASIDENTGAVTIHSAGNTVLAANFKDPEDKYESSTATFALKVIDPNTIVFSADDESFDGLGAYVESENKAVTKTFKSASGKPYSFTIFYCTKGSGAKKGCLQMRSNEGYVTSPSFEASFSYGYKVTVYYTAAEKHEDLTISSNPSLEVKSTTEESGGGTVADPEYVTTISLPLSTATFTMTANKGVKYVSRIELTPLAAPEIETVTLDETSDNISTVISDNADKTVNVTLKRSISKDYLNTVCLPFALSADQVAEVFGEGSVVSDYTSVTGTVMNFTPVTEMVANHPYIVKATETFDTKNISGVTLKTIVNDENSVGFKNAEGSFSAHYVGSPSIYTFTSVAGDQLFLGKDGKLYRPNAKDAQMKGMRAYFVVPGGTSNEAKVNIGGGLSSIDKLMNGEAMTGKVYNLNGQYVGNTLDGLAKGLYIMNGKKYVVK